MIVKHKIFGKKIDAVFIIEPGGDAIANTPFDIFKPLQISIFRVISALSVKKTLSSPK